MEAKNNAAGFSAATVVRPDGLIMFANGDRPWVIAENCKPAHIAAGKREFQDGERMGIKTLCGRMLWELHPAYKRKLTITKSRPVENKPCKHCMARA